MKVSRMVRLFLSVLQQPNLCPGRLTVEVPTSHTHTHTHSIGLPSKRDQLVTETATYTRDEHPCHLRNSNPQAHGHWDRIYLPISYFLDTQEKHATYISFLSV